MIRFIILFLALFASAAAAEPSKSALASDVARLSKFVRIVTGYETKENPKIVFRTQEQLDRMFFGAAYTGVVKNWISALSSDGVIFLNEDFEIGRDDYILAHELTHFMQFESGKTFSCLGASEPEAYHVQDIFVAATGRGKFSNPMTVLLASQCMPY